VSRPRLLLVDDDAALRRGLAELLASTYDVLEAGRPDAAIQAFEADAAIRLVVLDLMLPPSQLADEGARVLDAMVARRPAAKIVVVSGTGETRLPLTLLGKGAHDFLTKPVDPDVLEAVLGRATARLALEDRVAELERERSGDGDSLLGSAPAFVAARTLSERAAPTDIPVLLTGASGTGKEVFARHVHARSHRAGRSFMAVNCGALAPSLLESTLFGHRKGAFTGATSDAPGLFAAATGGTIFLDEIGDLALDLQVKLLRVLEEGEVLAVGAHKPQRVDVRVIAATHRPLAAMVESGAFRSDLYWRLRGIEIELPRLAERPGDLGVLAQHFLNLARSLVPGAQQARLSPDALRALEVHPFPGNLRELRNEMQRALVLAGGRAEILVEDLSPTVRAAASHEPATVAGDGGEEGATLEAKIASLERRELRAALDATGGNKSRAAERLGLSRQGLLNKLARHGIG
jgi:DNA-binding NtrC family response regulator